jgi:hypothetical protein
MQHRQNPRPSRRVPVVQPELDVAVNFIVRREDYYALRWSLLAIHSSRDCVVKVLGAKPRFIQEGSSPAAFTAWRFRRAVAPLRIFFSAFTLRIRVLAGRSSYCKLAPYSMELETSSMNESNRCETQQPR